MNRIQDASPDSGDKMWPPGDAKSSVAMQTSRRVRHIAAPAGGLYNRFRKSVLQPARLAQTPPQQRAGGDDAAQHQREAPLPGQPRHVREVHAVEAEDHGRDGQDGTPAGQGLHDLVLGVPLIRVQ